MDSRGIVPHHLSKVDAIHILSNSRRSNMSIKFRAQGRSFQNLISPSLTLSPSLPPSLPLSFARSFSLSLSLSPPPLPPPLSAHIYREKEVGLTLLCYDEYIKIMFSYIHLYPHNRSALLHEVSTRLTFELCAQGIRRMS
jgi:hypothetical protein